MSIALSEFWTRLVRSGITDAPGCKRLAAAFSDANAGTPPTDVDALAKFLIKVGKLTSFQANALLADQPREIRAGGFLIESDSSAPPLTRWVRASRIEDRRSGLLLRASAEQLAGGRMEWLGVHKAVTGPSLQPFESERDWTSTLVFSPLPPGRSLRDLIADGISLTARESCEIGIAIAKALEALHGRPLIHGSVRPDHVWVTDDGRAILLRDPSGPPLGPAEDASASWIDQLDPPFGYAAPEFAADGQACNQGTDIYSLGCLIFRLVSGRNPYDGDSAAQTIAAHASETPPELADAVAQGESGNPLFRVIAFAMAKSPAARFATAQQLASALRATLPLLPKPAEKIVQKESKKVKSSSDPAETKPARKKVSKTDSTDRKTATPSKLAPPVTSDTPPRKSTAKVDAKPKPKRVEDSVPAQATPALPTRPPAPSRTAERESDAPPPASAPPQESATTTPSALAPTTSATRPDTSEPPPSRPVRRRKKKKTKAPFVLGALCVAVLMLLIGLVVHDPSEPVAEKKKRPPIPDVIPPVSSRTNGRPVTSGDDERPAVDSPAGYELVSDDRLLFVPPYAADSATAPLELLPPGPGVIVSVRLASISQSPIQNALSPELESMIGSVVSRCKVPIQSISRCTAALHPGKDGWPEVSLAIELDEPRPASELIDAWEVAASRTPDGATIYAGDSVDGDAYYVADVESEAVSRFAVGSVERMSEVAAAEGGAIPLSRIFQALWASSSNQSDLVVLITPNFLFADGRQLLQSSAPELIRPLKSVLQPDVAAALVTAHFGVEQVYAETRLAPSGGISEAALMRAIRESIEQWPRWADEFIVESVPDPSWRLLASRLPSMMRFVVSQTRFGISEGAIVANTYLPPQAVPQVALATLLAMNTPSDSPATVASAPQSRSLSVDEMLARKMSVSFDQESLEFAVDAIVGAFKESLPGGSVMPTVRIIGGDLQLMGITQNQQVRDFEKSDLPLRTVLTDLVVGANPDKSATGSRDPKQALIWVVADDPDDPGKKVIFITTRQAAEDKYELPNEFQPAT